MNTFIESLSPRQGTLAPPYLKSSPKSLIIGLFVIWALIGFSEANENPGNRPALATLEALQKISEIAIEESETALQLALEQERQVETGSLDDAYLKLARIQILLANNRLSEAIDPLSQTIEYGVLDPATRERTVRGLGHVFYQLDRRTDLLALFDKQFQDLEALAPETLQLYAVALLENGQAAQAIQRCELALSKKAQLDLTICQIAAAALQSQERHSDSARYIELMLAHKPDDAALWDQLAAAYYRAGTLWKVLGTIDRAQEKGFKTDPASQVSIIEILYELEHYAATAERIEEWIDRDPDTLEKRLWFLLVYCYEQQNLDTQATATLERASRLTPWPEMDLQLADRHWKSDDYALVYEDIIRAMNKGPVSNPADAWTLAAAAAISLERLEDAAKALVKARESGADQRKIQRLEHSIEKLRIQETEDAIVAR